MEDFILFILSAFLVIIFLIWGVCEFSWAYARYEDEYCAKNPSAFNCVLQMEKAKNAVLTQGK